MTRVSENSSQASLKYAMNKAKSKLEDLQIKGSTLKRISRPSDDPIANVEALEISSLSSDNKQFLRNGEFAMMQLSMTEKSLEHLTDLLVSAKEIAIAQSSDFYDADIRKNVSNEIIQLRNQALAIANKRMGPRYLFGGFSTLKTPFNREGEYMGDRGEINLEVSKDFFVPINLNGEEVFFATPTDNTKKPPPTDVQSDTETKESLDLIPDGQRDLASVKPKADTFQNRANIFSQLSSLITALETDDSKVIQDLLEQFDGSISRLITLRTKIGSLTNNVLHAKNSIEDDEISSATRKSHLVDADIAELFTDLNKQQQVLKTSYSASWPAKSVSLGFYPIKKIF